MTVRGSTTYAYNGDGALAFDGTTHYTQDLAAPLTQVLQTTQGATTSNYLHGLDRLAAVLMMREWLDNMAHVEIHGVFHRRRWLISIGIISFILRIIFTSFVLIWQRHENTYPPVTTGLRGGVFMIVRVSANTNDIDQIWVNEAGTATRGSPIADNRNSFHLTSTEQKAIQDVHASWCIDDTNSETLQSTGAGYDIGLLCEAGEAWWIKHLRVPDKDMPSVLIDIIRRTKLPQVK